MRLPVRTRGVAAGLLLLAVSPLIALTGSHHPATAAAPNGGARATAAESAAAVAAREIAVYSFHYVRPRDPSLSEPTPAPTLAPPPAQPAPPIAKKPHVVPLPAGPPPAPGTIEAIIQVAATKWGVSYPWMLKIARCESGLNPRAYNPAGPYIGLFQFLPSTFHEHGGTNIYDPAQQADITGFMLSHGGANAWACA